MKFNAKSLLKLSVNEAILKIKDLPKEKIYYLHRELYPKFSYFYYIYELISYNNIDKCLSKKDYLKREINKLRILFESPGYLINDQINFEISKFSFIKKDFDKLSPINKNTFWNIINFLDNLFKEYV